MCELSGQVAVVFGGAGGIGRVVCNLLMQHGAQVVAADICSLADSTGNECSAGSPSFYKCDITRQDNVDGTFEHAEQLYGAPATIVVNSVGVLHETEWQQCVDITLSGTIRTTKTGLRHLSKDHGHGGGVVVNVASLHGLYPVAFIPVYSACKHGVIALTRAFALPDHYEKHGVRFNCVCPDGVDTPMQKQASVPGRVLLPETLADRFKGHVNLTTLEVAEVIVDLIRNADANGRVMQITTQGGVEAMSFPEEPYLRSDTQP